MKKLLITAMVMTLLLPSNGCSIFKKKNSIKVSEVEERKNDISLKREKFSVDLVEKKGISESSSTVASEEITIKKAQPEDIELTANFRIDTSAMREGDTDTLKLVDIKNKAVSISIYQNRKTNELMAKVKTEHGVQTTPFSEINIKKNYTKATTTVDTSKFVKNFVLSRQDSIDKTLIKKKSLTKSVIKEKTEKSSINFIWIIIAIGILATIVLFILNNKFLPWKR